MTESYEDYLCLLTESYEDYIYLPEDHLPLKGIQENDIVPSDILLESCEGISVLDHLGNIYYEKKLHSPSIIDQIHRSRRWNTVKIAFSLVRQLRSEGIRFLAKEPCSGLWLDAGNFRMRVKISQDIRKRQTELRMGLVKDREIQFTIKQGDIFDFEADVLAVKHAQQFFGVDKAVAAKLDNGRNEFKCEPYGYRLKTTDGRIRATSVLFVGMPHYFLWDYYQIQEFSRRCLEILQIEAPGTQHLALTLHGLGMGLEEFESFLAELRGCLIAMHLAQVPTNLERITLVESDIGRANRLQRVLEQVLSSVDFAERMDNDPWGYRLIASRIPPTHDPLQDLQVHPDEDETNIETPTQYTKPSIPPSKWCISYQQLMNLDRQAASLYGAEKYDSMTMRDICEDIIKPSCSRTGTSYALYLNNDGLPIDAFVSHSWDGHFSSFVQSIRDAFQTTMIKPNLWICAFALMQVQGQHDNNDIIAQQVGTKQDPLEESPFVLAIQEASVFCVVRNPHKDIYRRIWCVCELLYAQQCRLFPSKTHVTGPDTFARDSRTSVLDAEATRLEDRDRILRVLLTEFDRSEIDSIVHQLRTQETPVPIGS